MNSFLDFDITSNFELTLLAVILLVVVPIIVILVIEYLKEIGQVRHVGYKKVSDVTNTVRKNDVSVRMYNRTDEITSRIKEHDEHFDSEVFLEWTELIFAKVQEAWSKKDIEALKTLESPELFEQNSVQLKAFIDSKRRNVIEDINIRIREMYDYKVEAGKEIIAVNLQATLKDYVLDDLTGNIIQGDKNYTWTNKYKLIFMRKEGMKSHENSLLECEMKCPNCGASQTIKSIDRCKYCATILTNNLHGFTLCKLQLFK